MASIREPRYTFKDENDKFEFPVYFEQWEKCLTSVWNYKEVPMESDVKDWEGLSEIERKIAGGILRGFTQIELPIGDYWANDVPLISPKHEVVMMAKAFSFFETLHAVAYNHLSASLNINEYEAFMGDETAQRKVRYLMDSTSSDKVRLAIFSGAAEGVALFSSFSILLSFNNKESSKLKGLTQIISWSILDEQQHSDYGIQLFRDIVKEEGLSIEELYEILNGFKLVLDNEITFLYNVFDKVREVNGIPLYDFLNFIKGRANERFKKLNIPDELLQDTGLNIDKELPYDEHGYANVNEWFSPLAKGNISNDFFAHTKEGSQYISKPTFTHLNVNLNNLNFDTYVL